MDEAEARQLLASGGPAKNELTILPRGPAMLSICCFAAMFLFLPQCAGEGVPAAATPNRTILAAV
ncbi:MAG: hypothetical protein WB420_01945 [Bradyrhizobium sp.]